MISIGKIYSFSAGHHLPHHGGQCKNVHGHNYRLEVEVTGKIDEIQTGMVMDFEQLDKIVDRVILSVHDHCYLNDLFINPTAELMVESFSRKIINALNVGFILTRLKLWETEKCYAEWTPVHRHN